MVMGNDPLATLAGRNAVLDAPICQCQAEPVRVIAPVRDQRLGRGQRGQQRPGAQIVAPMSCAQKHPNRSAPRVAGDVELEVQPALGAADEATALRVGAPF